MKRTFIIIACLLVVLVPTMAVGINVVDWADKYIVGLLWVDHHGVNDTTVRIVSSYDGYDSSWSILGLQNVSQGDNAVTMTGSYRRDRTGSDCGYVNTEINRYRYDGDGYHYSLGDSCPPESLENWVVFPEGNDYWYTNTCSWGDSATYVSSRILEEDHSNISSYLSGTYGYYYGYDYIVKMQAWAFPDDGDLNDEEKHACFSILWYQDS